MPSGLPARREWEAAPGQKCSDYLAAVWGAATTEEAGTVPVGSDPGSPPAVAGQTGPEDHHQTHAEAGAGHRTDDRAAGRGTDHSAGTEEGKAALAGRASAGRLQSAEEHQAQEAAAGRRVTAAAAAWPARRERQAEQAKLLRPGRRSRQERQSAGSSNESVYCSLDSVISGSLRTPTIAGSLGAADFAASSSAGPSIWRSLTSEARKTIKLRWYLQACQ